MDVIYLDAWTGQDLLLEWASAAVKGLLVMSVAVGAFVAVRRTSAAFRHLYWMLALGVVLLIPMLGIVLPDVRVGVLPAGGPEPASLVHLETPFSLETPISLEISSLQGTRNGGVGAGELEMRGPAATHDPAPASTDGRSPSAVLDPSATPEPFAAAPAVPAGLDWGDAPWTYGVLVAWLIGMFAVTAHLVLGIGRARRLVAKAQPVTDPEWLDLMDEVGDRLVVRRRVQLLRTRDVRVPMSWGVRRPVVMIPADADSWSIEKRRCVLAHEMAHVKRFDCLTQGIGSLACAAHWFNPLVWWAAHRARLEREIACDAAVPEAARTRASAYAGHLLDIARVVNHRFRVPSPVVTMARRSQLEGRVLSILDGGKVAERLRPGQAAAALGAAAVLVGVLSAMHPAPRAGSAAAVTVTVDGASPSIAPFVSAGSNPSEGAPGAKGPIQDVVKRTFDVSQGGTLEIDTESGNIRIETSDRNSVDVEVRRTARGNADEEDFEISFRQSAGTVEVTGERRQQFDGGRNGVEVEFFVVVPRRFNLNLDTSGGNISVDDLDGVVETRTAGGNLSFGQISGSIDAHTSGGNISVDVSGGDIDVTTSGGNIALGRVSGTVSARTSGGNISVDEVNGAIEAVTSGGQISARLARQPEGDSILETSGGSITVYLADDIRLDLDAETSGGRVDTDVEVLVEGRLERDRLRGTINGGGPRLVLDTAAGAIHIRRL